MHPLLFVFVSLGVWLVWKLVTTVLHRSPLDNLPGPRPMSMVAGRSSVVMLSPNCPLIRSALGDMAVLFTRHAWSYLDSLQAYGGVSKITGMFGVRAASSLG